MSPYEGQIVTPKLSEVDPKKWPIVKYIKNYQIYRLILKQSRHISGISPQISEILSYPKLEISLCWHNFSKEINM